MTSTMKGVLVVGSNATTLQLQSGRTFPVGNYLNEMVVPMQMLRAAGWPLLVATPDGTRPPLDARSMSPNHFDGDPVALAAAKAFCEDDTAFHNVVTLRSVLAQG